MLVSKVCAYFEEQCLRKHRFALLLNIDLLTFKCLFLDVRLTFSFSVTEPPHCIFTLKNFDVRAKVNWLTEFENDCRSGITSASQSNCFDICFELLVTTTCAD